MDTIELRSRVHALIDAIKSEELLQRIHDLLTGNDQHATQGVWEQLTEAQRERVLKAYDASFRKGTLSTTEQVMKRRKG